MTETKPKRRWFRFSLRTMLVAITLFGLWLGWEVRQVQVRKDWVARILAAGGKITWPDGIDFSSSFYVPQVSWYRRMIGDHAAVSILIVASDPSNHDKTKAEIAAVESEFPEAGVTAMNRDGNLIHWLLK